MLAAKEFDLNVQIRDSGGDAKRATDAVSQLVEKEHVAAIVGPLNADPATAAAKRAQALGVPLVVMTMKEALSRTGPFVFRAFVSSRAEIHALVTKARENGGQRFGILYPDSGFGRTMRGLYVRELENSHLDLAVEVSYPPSVNTFSKEIKKLAAGEFDVLFVPDSAARIALIAPALAAQGMWSIKPGEEPKGPGRGIQVVALSIGYSSDLIRRAGRYLDGALFTTFFSPDASPFAREFQENYLREYGSEPDYLAAFGYDAMILIGTALKKEPRDRDEIRRWLSEGAASDSEILRTTTRLRGFDESGAPLLDPWIYQLTKEGFVLVP
jgi:ABC-type branched-subunit amino acid transport system substrate-binding protein